MTEKLYYSDSYISEFEATVLSCEPRGIGYSVTFDRTAFFPEGGGQPADTGTVNGIRVTDVHEHGGIIYHYTEAPLAAGLTVTGKLDFDRRFRLMQNHGGEHIVSGTVNRRFGLNNVGFHMGSEDITVDYDGFLDREALREIEYESNRLVFRNIAVSAYFPSPDELSQLHYRAKKAIDGAVRIVSIENCDVCACCAPHLSHTAEIGIIKILDSFRYKGGIRIHLHCGFDALDDYSRKYDTVRTIAGAMSVRQDDAAEAFLRLESEFSACRAKAASLKNEILNMKTQLLTYSSGNLCLFERDLSGDGLRKYADAAADKCRGVCAVFSGEDGNYNYVIVSRTVPLRTMAKEINAALGGKGGGSDEMIQGRAVCTADAAKEFFLNVKCN